MISKFTKKYSRLPLLFHIVLPMFYCFTSLFVSLSFMSDMKDFPDGSSSRNFLPYKFLDNIYYSFWENGLKIFEVLLTLIAVLSVLSLISLIRYKKQYIVFADFLIYLVCIITILRFILPDIFIFL
jgi:hypothetical protein